MKVEFGIWNLEMDRNYHSQTIAVYCNTSFHCSPLTTPKPNTKFALQTHHQTNFSGPSRNVRYARLFKLI